MTMEYEDKYLVRLAQVYLDKYETHGFDVAKDWYDGFLTPELQRLIKPFVAEEVEKRLKN